MGTDDTKKDIKKNSIEDNIEDNIKAEYYLYFFCYVLASYAFSKKYNIQNYYKFKRDLTESLDYISGPAVQTVKQHALLINSKLKNFTHYNASMDSNFFIPSFKSLREIYLYFQFMTLFSLNPNQEIEKQEIPCFLFPLYIGILSNLGFKDDDWKELRFNAYFTAMDVQTLMSSAKNNIIFPSSIPYQMCYKYLLNYYFSDSAFLCINELDGISISGIYETANRHNKKQLMQRILQINTYTLTDRNKLYNQLFEFIKKYQNVKSEIYHFDSNEIISSSIQLHSNIISKESDLLKHFFEKFKKIINQTESEDTTNVNLNILLQEFKNLHYEIDL